MRFTRMVTADERVDRFELVDETVLKQEVERPIDRWRRGHTGAVLEMIEQVIGLDRNRCFGDELQHAQANRGEAQAAFIANPGHIAHERIGIVSMGMISAGFSGRSRHESLLMRVG